MKSGAEPFHRYLVVNNRRPDAGDMDDIYLLTTEQWQRFRELRGQGQDVCTASSNTVEDDEFGEFKAVGPRPPHFSTYAEFFLHVREHGWLLMDAEIGIGY